MHLGCRAPTYLGDCSCGRAVFQKCQMGEMHLSCIRAAGFSELLLLGETKQQQYTALVGRRTYRDCESSTRVRLTAKMYPRNIAFSFLFLYLTG